jgi:hypothetical protein
MWLWKLRRLNGPRFTWPLLMFAQAIPEKLMEHMGRIYIGRPLKTKTRRELLASIRPAFWRYLRPDTGDTPDETSSISTLHPPPAGSELLPVVS